MKMKKQEFYFDSRDGESKIHALRYEPEEKALVDGKPVAVLQIIHGMAEYVERYEKTAEFFTERGFVVTGHDHLGHGGSVAEDGTYGYFCKRDPATVVVRDAHRLKKMTQALYPGVPYFILGHSMGSYILRNYMFRYGTGIQGVILMGAGLPSMGRTVSGKAVAAVQKLFCGGKHVSRLLNRLVLGPYNRRLKEARTPNDWLSRDEGNVDRYNADSKCGFIFTVNGFETIFELAARARDRENLEKIPAELPVLLLSGAEDPVGDYGEGVRRLEALLAAAGMNNLTLKLYEGNRHEILNEADGTAVMQDMYDWITRNLPGDTL
jgi:alpha-beta hydrolase superfamily lysophospholipase